MKRLIVLLFSLSLFGCRDNPSQPPLSPSLIDTHVYFGNYGVPEIKILLVQTNDTLRTDSAGHAIFAVPAGHYFVRAFGLQGPGPGLPTLTDTVDTHTGETTKVEIFDCLACVSMQQTDGDVNFTLSAAPANGNPTNPVTLTIGVLNSGMAPKAVWKGCDFRLVPGVDYQLYGSASSLIFLSDPRLRPLCPDFEGTFHPGEKFSGTLTFNGLVYDQSGNRHQAPAGVYMFVAKFTYSPVGNWQQSITLERRVSFGWSLAGQKMR